MRTTDVYYRLGQVRPEIIFRKGDTKGKLGTRCIPVIEDMRLMLLNYYPSPRTWFYFPGIGKTGHLCPDSASRILRKACNKVGVQGVSTHSFRRTSLTLMSNEGIPLRIIQEVSGHRSLSQLQKYLEVSPEQVRGAVSALSMLSPVKKTTNVLKQYEKVFGLLKQWKYEIKVAWWQQITVEDGDIDEIDELTQSTIIYLTPKAFIKLAEKQQYIAQAKDSWCKSKHFTAQKQIHQRHFKSKLPASNTATFIKSTTGSGKTTKLVKWLKELEDMGAICLGYRNTLLLQWCADSGFYHLHEHDGLRLIGWDSSRIALCIDSLGRFEPEDFEGKVLILDEVCSVIRHGLFSQTVKNREHILNLFAEAIRRCIA